MQTNILWTGREYGSLENCIIKKNSEYIEINSVIIGLYDNKIYGVEYYIKTSPAWHTRFCEAKIRVDGKTDLLRFFKHENGAWSINGVSYAKFDGRVDVDISLTPFTNTLAINRLNLNVNEECTINVLYLDVLAHEVKPVKQKYIKLSDAEYKYQNVPNDFEAVVQIDECGFITDYPGLFVQTAKSTINHP